MYTKSFTLNGETIEVTLNQNQVKDIDRLPEGMRQQFADALLQVKIDAEVKTRSARSVFSMKVGELGNILVYGLDQRYPVSLYQEQWTKLLSHSGEIASFIGSNQAVITTALAGASDVRKRRAEEAKSKANSGLKIAK